MFLEPMHYSWIWHYLLIVVGCQAIADRYPTDYGQLYWLYVCVVDACSLWLSSIVSIQTL